MVCQNVSERASSRVDRIQIQNPIQNPIQIQNKSGSDPIRSDQIRSDVTMNAWGRKEGEREREGERNRVKTE